MDRKKYISAIMLSLAVILTPVQAFGQASEQASGQEETAVGPEGDSTARISITGDYHKESSDTVEITPQLIPDRIREAEKAYRENKPGHKPSSPPDITIDNTLYVGTTAGSVGVTETGAASYLIPIEVPEGIAGLKPSVSIGYNSQAGNGLAGYGWNLSASSAVSRCGKTFYYDNAADAPQLTAADNLMLDGRRLILISGQNLTNGAKYRLEYDPATDITYKVVGSYYGFAVRTGDGSTREYGSTANSNIRVSGSGTLFWLLSKVTDKNGNIMTCNYDVVANNGEFYPSEINYAGNRKIQFTYETRSDKQKGYLAGAVVNCNKRLKNISTYIGSTKIKEYELDYDSGGLYSKLTEVIEKGQDNAQYNPVVINYEGSETYADEYFSSLSENRQGLTPLFADFNGDGKMDFLSYPNKTSYTTQDSATLFLAGTFYGDVYFYKKCRIPMQFSGAVFQGFILADLNGDGRMDAVNISRAQNNTYRYNYYLYDGERLTYNYIGFNTDGNVAFTGDFDGDGKEDILVKSNNKVFNGAGTQIASGGIDNWGSAYIEDYYPNCRYLCDFNGNGKTDLLAINSSGAWVYELNGSSFTKLTSFNTTDIKNYYFPYFGDFNGDGKTDVLIRNTNQGYSNDVSILYSTGKGFVKQSISGADIKAKVFVSDFNKDGKSDIFHLEIVNNAVVMKVGTYNGVDFNTAYYSTFLSPSDFDVPYEYEKFLFQAADFDGDGRAEFCNAKYVDTYITHTFTDDNDLLARTITNGLGAQVSFDYAPITDNGYCSYTGESVSFPVSGSAFPLYVVTNMGQYAGSYYDNTTYSYKNPHVHMQGKGFLGFGEITASNYNKDRKAVTKYGYNATYYYPFTAEIKTTTRQGADISTSVYENTHIYQGTKRVTPYVRKRTDTDHLTGTVKTEECTQIDSWANPLTVVAAYGNDVTETVTSSWFNSGTDNLWILGLPLSVQKQTAKGSATWTEKQTFEYNAQNLLRKSVNYTGDGTKKVSEKAFVYDGFGNVTRDSSKTYSSPDALTTSYEYSTDGVYLTKITDPLSLETVYGYNSYGRIVSETDPRNNTTTYGYDDMGRPAQDNYPDGTSSSTAFTWGGSVYNSVYCITKSATGQPAEKIYFDAFNRELRSSTVRFDGTEIHNDRKYDAAWRIYQESLPFRASSTPVWNTYSYDGYGRISQVSFASGKTNTFTYSGNSVTETKDGMAFLKTYNARGELVSAADPGGSISYNLRPDGQPASIVAIGVSTLFGYDEYGRQTTIDDPGAGVKTFGYDDAGNLSLETDAAGRSKAMTYDRYGRITSKALPEFTTTYRYNDYGQLVSDSSSNVVFRTRQYDGYGRLYRDRDSGPDGKWLEKTYSYSGGNISSIQFNSHSGTVGTESYSYGYGNLEEITFGGTSVWKLNAENAMGLPASVSTGNITRSYAYDSYGSLTGRSATSAAGGTFQNYSYGFNASTGNLTFRKDNGRNIQENFTYDGVNRLSSFGDYSMDYYESGNIESKDDAGGLYSYCLPNNFYGLSELYDATGEAIPPREQYASYTSFERTSGISENGYEALFTYDGNGARKRMQMNHNGTTEYRRYYLGERYEAELGASANRQFLYIGGDAYSAPAVLVNQGSSWELYYICRDHLGSMTHLVNASGTVAYEYSYDAWGRLRDPATLATYAPDNEPALFLNRGYTGHEHLPLFGLINMNARLYDPALGLFLSPDPYIQAPDFSQNYNTYAYCLNNPLKYTDQTGEYLGIDDLIAAIVGGVINLGVNIWQGNIKGDFWTTIGKGAAAFGSGAVAGFGALYPEFGGWAWGGATVGATNAWLGGAKGWDIAIGAGVGMVSSYAGGVAGQWGGKYIGGVIINGANITSPVLQGAISGTAGGAVGGYVGGFTAGLIMTGDLGEANSAGWKGAAFGAPIGGISGSVSGYRYAVDNDINPWTGKTFIKNNSEVAFSEVASQQKFNSVENLIDEAGTLSRLKGGVKQGFINGNADDIFKGLSQQYGSKIQINGSEKFFQSGNIRIGLHGSVRGEGISTLHINNNGQLYKIRIIP